MKYKMLAPACLVVAALIAAGCGSSGSGSGNAGSGSTPASHSAAGSMLKSAKIGGTTVLTNAQGFTLYWFVPDTRTKSNCNGSCATFWPPVKGSATLASGVKGKVGTITRADGSTQATYNGHPLYTYKGDTKPGQNSGNGLNQSGGLWHEVTVGGSADPAPAPAGKSSSSSGGGYGY